MHIPGIIRLLDQCARLVRGLLPSQDMEIVICRMSSGMALSPDRCSKDDQIPDIPHEPGYTFRAETSSLGDASMYDKHAPHRTSGIVEDPFSRVAKIGRERGLGMILDELSEESGDDDGCVGRRGGMGGRCERKRFEDRGVERFWSEDVKVVLSKLISLDG